MSNWYSYPNRTLCSVLEEMRQALKNKHLRHLPGLIEEAQTYANRMEAALEDWRDVRIYTERKGKLKKKIKDLEDKVGESKEDL